MTAPRRRPRTRPEGKASGAARACRAPPAARSPQRLRTERPTATRRPATATPAGSRRKFASLSSFVIGQSNRLAFVSAEMIARRPGQITPLLIHGPTGVGKTHLLEGIWSASRRASREQTAVYLSAEQFTSLFLEALRGSGLPSFRRKYRGVSLLILDDLQFLVGKRATQVELLHTVDTMLREGRQLVFSADRPPAELAELGPELTARLSSGLVCPIEPPDFATRLGVAAHMAKRLGVDVPVEVQRLIASRMTCHAREISGAICRLQAASQAMGLPDHARPGRGRLGRHDPPAQPRRPPGRHPEGRLRRFRTGAGQPAIRGQAKAAEPSADVGHVVCAEAHPRSLERNRRFLRPPQPQHGDLGARSGSTAGWPRASRCTFPSGPGRSTTPFARSSGNCWPGEASCRFLTRPGGGRYDGPVDPSRLSPNPPWRNSHDALGYPSVSVLRPCRRIPGVLATWSVRGPAAVSARTA